MASGIPFSASRSFSGPLASTNGLISRQPLPAAKPTPVVDLQALQSASRVLQDQFIKDAQVIPDLVDTLTTRE
jgi:nuclear pore complex protein Nup155